MVYWILSYWLFGAFLKNEPAPGDTPFAADSLTVQVVNYDQLKPMLQFDNDTTYVVNFWATWCSPCVQELPYFVALDSMHRGEAFRLILVSLDFRKDYLRKLEPFIADRGLRPYVIALDDQRANYWIDDIDPSWSGAIPATLVYRGNRRTFYEKTFHQLGDLDNIVKPFLNL